MTARYSQADVDRFKKILDRGQVPRRVWVKTSLSAKCASHYSNEVKRFLNRLGDMFRQGRGLFIFGGPQTGKQCAAGIVLRNVVKRSKMVLFIEAEDLRRAAFPGNRPLMFDDNTTMWERAEQVDALCITHLGIEKRTDDFRAVLSTLLRKRSSMRRITLITSYLAPNEVRDEYGDDVASSIQSSFTAVACD